MMLAWVGWIGERVARVALRVLIAWWPERASVVISDAAADHAKDSMWTALVRQRIADAWVAEGKAR